MVAPAPGNTPTMKPEMLERIITQNDAPNSLKP
jgi:hypothetical protein